MKINNSNQYGTYDEEAYRSDTARSVNAVTSKSWINWNFMARLCLVGFLSLMLFQYYPVPSKISGGSAMDLSDVNLDRKYYKVLSIINKDYIEADDDKLNSYYPFLKSDDVFLIEPYRLSYVLLESTDMDSSCSVSWTLRKTSITNGQNSLDSVVTEGVFEAGAQEFAIFPKTRPGKYYLSFQNSCNDNIGEVVVWVKYIRRELTTLTDNDREEFLDAYYTLWEVNTKEGKARFGDRYKSLYYLSMLHHDAANGNYCDEFHSGNGFLLNHVMISSYLEQSLQLINPRVCLHYMEYSKYFESDAFRHHLEHALDGGNWTELMTSKWFGKNDAYTGEILDGRWAAAKIPRMNAAFFAEHEIDPHQSFFPHNNPIPAHASGNPYGLLRSAWNFSPHEGILRFNNVDRISSTLYMMLDSVDYYIQAFAGVDCAPYFTYVEDVAKGMDMEDLMSTMEDGIHGGAHFTIAGAGGDPQAASDAIWRERFGMSIEELLDITAMSQVYPHFQMQLPSDDHLRTMECHDYPFQNGNLISYGHPGKPGGPWCTVIPNVLESDEAMDDLISTFFSPGGYTNIIDKLQALPTDLKREAIQLLHQRYQYDGDLASSTGSVDPIFWTIHGSLERLFQRLLLADMVSDKAFTTNNDCTGHSAMGKKIWLNGFFFQDESVDASDLTNAEILEILDPTSSKYPEMVPYVYSSMTWQWCNGLDSLFSK